MVDYKNFSDDDDPVRLAFKKLFGDMYLSESETALRIFEYGYKAGAAAENEACANACETQIERWVDERARYAAGECFAAIRARMK